VHSDFPNALYFGKQILFPAAKKTWKIYVGIFSGFRNFGICPDIQNLTSVEPQTTPSSCLPNNALYNDWYAKVMLHPTLHSTSNPLSLDNIHYLEALCSSER
jgi:hypothetical protein